MRPRSQTPAKNPETGESARYALVVDRQLKRWFDQRETAEAEARRILDRFPHLNVGVEDREGYEAHKRTRF